MKKTTTILTLLIMMTSTAASAEDNLLERQLAADVGSDVSAVFACALGERVPIDARGIHRVSTDNSTILKVSADDDTLFITCKELGTTQLTVEREDRLASITVRVGEAYEAEVPSIDGCELRGVKARVVLDKSGKVHQMVVDGSDSQALCLRKALRDVSWTSSEQFLRVARWSW